MSNNPLRCLFNNQIILTQWIKCKMFLPPSSPHPTPYTISSLPSGIPPMLSMLLPISLTQQILKSHLPWRWLEDKTQFPGAQVSGGNWREPRQQRLTPWWPLVTSGCGALEMRPVCAAEELTELLMCLIFSKNQFKSRLQMNQLVGDGLRDCHTEWTQKEKNKYRILTHICEI